MDNTEINNRVIYQLYIVCGAIITETEGRLFVVYGHWTEMVGCFVGYIN